MWIIPKNLPLSNGVRDTLEFNLDLEELSQIFELSLMQRSKHSLARTWLLRLKRDSWMQLLSGRILRHSQARFFAGKWTVLLPDTHVSPSLQQENDRELTTQGISGRQSEAQSISSNPTTVSLKTSKDTYRLDSPQSLAIWKKMVIEQRGEFFQRKNAAPHTEGTESSSSQQGWATPNTLDGLPPRGVDGLIRQATGARKGRRLPANLREQVDPVSCEVYRQINWPTASARDYKDTPGMSVERDGRTLGRIDQLPRAVYHYGRQDQITLNTSGSPQGLLNPRWSEILMGIPMGWTMPSCATPLTIEQMNSALLEMESSPKS